MSKKVEKWLKPEGLKQIEEWAKQGISKHGIALMMGVHRTTLWEWCKEHESLRIAVEIGREYLIQDLQLALYNAALGEVATEATVIETEVFLDGREAVRKRNTTTRKEKPDTTALIFLLKNLSRYHPVSNPDGWLSDPATQFSRELTMMMNGLVKAPEVFALVAEEINTLPDLAAVTARTIEKNNAKYKLSSTEDTSKE